MVRPTLRKRKRQQVNKRRMVVADEFKHDVFLSHSAKDKAVVRDVAERLRKDGVKVWFDEWVLKSGDSIPAKIEEGLEHSRVLVLCMLANAFGSARTGRSWRRARSAFATR